MAKQRELAQEYAADLEELEQQLSLAPLTFGDPVFDYHHLGLGVYHATLALVHVYYAVDEVRRLVYIKEIAPLPGQALDA